MANLFLNIPVAAGNATSAAVDFSAFGASKSIIVTGSWLPHKQPTIIVEINNDPLKAGSWASVASFQGQGVVVIDTACWWMRVRVTNNLGGNAPEVNIAGQSFGTVFAAITAPAGAGPGAAVDISTAPAFKTVQIGGTFQGVVIVEVSTDGNTEWGQVLSFSGPGEQDVVVTANWMRVRRTGIDAQLPAGTPIVNMGATIGSGGGGGGGSGVDVDEEGVPIGVGPYSLFNFTGGGVTATDAGGGEATINIPGITLQDETVDVAGAPHDTFNFTGPAVVVTDAGGGVADITCNGGMSFQDDSTPIGFFEEANIFGSGVQLTVVGGVLQVEIPGIFFEKDTVPVGGAPHFVANFTGAGVTLSNPLPDTVGIAIPGNTSYLGCWFEQDLASASAGQMSAKFSQNFTSWKAIRPGSIAGLVTRLSEAVTDGSVRLDVMINGVATAATLTHTAILNTNGGIITNAPGAIPYVAGDLISMQWTTNLAFLPNTLDAEAAISIFETP